MNINSLGQNKNKNKSQVKESMYLVYLQLIPNMGNFGIVLVIRYILVILKKI